MTSESAYFKRIKRHIVGRSRTYFVITAPGLETLCLNELNSHPLSVKDSAVIPGGIEFQGRLIDCYLANLHLRAANRILMRIQTFKATNFRQLKKKVFNIPWELYLPKGLVPKVHITTKHCRLHHTVAISERILRNISKRFAQSEFNQVDQTICKNSHEIYVRGLEDRFTVSIDSSGDILYKRGLKIHKGRAPLRETLAAAALLLAGYKGSEPLIDPMCGSGTFSLEAALMAKRIPPGWFRSFAFIEWPSFQLKPWEYIKRQAESNFVRPKRPLIFASDIDSNACRKLEQCLQTYDLSDAVNVQSKDFFAMVPRELTDQVGVVVINPPYGRRIGCRQESEDLFHSICNKIKRDYKGWKVVLFAPNRQLAGQVPFEVNMYPMLHGGLKLTVLAGKII
jgi:putative N6-adenine-specific DNA methylase